MTFTRERRRGARERTRRRREILETREPAQPTLSPNADRISFAIYTCVMLRPWHTRVIDRHAIQSGEGGGGGGRSTDFDLWWKLAASSTTIHMRHKSNRQFQSWRIKLWDCERYFDKRLRPYLIPFFFFTVWNSETSCVSFWQLGNKNSEAERERKRGRGGGVERTIKWNEIKLGERYEIT